MTPLPLRAVELRPRPLPCPHDRAGTPHPHLSTLLACVERYGNPGFEAGPEIVR